MAEKNAADAPQTSPQFIRSPDFSSVYANFTRFEPTVWDLKFTFGEVVEQSDQGGVVENHTAVSMAWPAAKVMALYLVLNLAIHEHKHGVIKISDTVMQPDIRHLAESSIEEIIKEAIAIRTATPPSTSLVPPSKKR
jgi:hypothetical protein